MDNQKKKNPSGFERRDFLKVGTAATVGFLARGVLPQTAHALPPLPSNAATPEAMPTRNLGRTGYRVGAFSLGGQAAIEKSNNEEVAVPIVERALDLDHVEDRDAFGDADDQRQFGVDGLQDGVAGERRRDVDHRRIGAGFFDRLGHGVEDRQGQVLGAALARRHPADHAGAVGNGLFGMERSLGAGKALADDLGVGIDENSH